MKIDKYSKLLAIISSNNLLKDKEIKSVIKHCIRTTTETTNYHCSVNYRSIEVEQKTEHLKSKSKYHQFCSKNFRHEHIVPCQVQYELLIELKDLSEKNIRKFLNTHSLRATITKEQDEKLNKSGLKSKMPREFYVKTKGYEEYFNNPFARYLSSGIMESLKVFENAQQFVTADC